MKLGSVAVHSIGIIFQAPFKAIDQKIYMDIHLPASMSPMLFSDNRSQSTLSSKGQFKKFHITP